MLDFVSDLMNFVSIMQAAVHVSVAWMQFDVDVLVYKCCLAIQADAWEMGVFLACHALAILLQKAA